MSNNNEQLNFDEHIDAIKYLIAIDELRKEENLDLLQKYLDKLAEGSIENYKERNIADIQPEELACIDVERFFQNYDDLVEHLPEVASKVEDYISNFDAWGTLEEADWQPEDIKYLKGNYFEYIQASSAFESRFPDKEKKPLIQELKEKKEDIIAFLSNKNTKLAMTGVALGIGALTGGAVALPAAKLVYELAKRNDRCRDAIESFENKINDCIAGKFGELKSKQREEHIESQAQKRFSISKALSIVPIGLAVAGGIAAVASGDLSGAMSKVASLAENIEPTLPNNISTPELSSAPVPADIPEPPEAASESISTPETVAEKIADSEPATEEVTASEPPGSSPIENNSPQETPEAQNSAVNSAPAEVNTPAVHEVNPEPGFMTGTMEVKISDGPLYSDIIDQVFTTDNVSKLLEECGVDRASCDNWGNIVEAAQANLTMNAINEFTVSNGVLEIDMDKVVIKDAAFYEQTYSNIHSSTEITQDIVSTPSDTVTKTEPTVNEIIDTGTAFDPPVNKQLFNTLDPNNSEKNFDFINKQNELDSGIQLA